MINVLFSDNHLLALIKPAMLSTQTGPSGKSLEEDAKEWLRRQTGKQTIFLHPIHRLDKRTSGIVLFARSSKALSRLNAAMRERRIGKTYYALVERAPPTESGQLIHYLKHGDFRAEIVSSLKEGGKVAELSYKVLKSADKHTLLEITLVTGRYHQIRAQLAAIGCTIVGDHKYGSQCSFPHPGIALHHTRIEFLHPISQEPIHLKSEPPFTTL